MNRFRSFWRNLLRRDRVESDLDEELRASFDLLVEDKIRSGMDPHAARRSAAIELHIESVKEEVRHVRAGSLVETMLQDARYAARLLRRNPIFAVTAALSLSIGIGATTTVFTVGNGLLLTVPYGVSDPGRLVEIARVEEGDFGIEPISYADYLALRERTKSFEGVYGYELNLTSLSLRDDRETERVFATYTTMSFFSVLGVRAAVGRLFDARDVERPGTSPIVVLSHRFWIHRFNGDPNVVGRTLSINNVAVTVIGVSAEGFRGASLLAPDIWLPAVMIPTLDPGTAGKLDFSPTNRRITWQMMMGGRLAPGVSRQQASAEVATIGRVLEQEQAASRERLNSLGIPLPQGAMVWRVALASPIPSGMRVPALGFLTLLMALTAIVLVIACSNLAGVLLARAAVRRREIAVRTAIGASRGRLVRQLLTETLLLFVLGGTIGIVLARAMTSLLVSLLPEFPLPVNLAVPLDGRVVAFSLILSLVSALLSGLAPALHASKADIVGALKDETHGTPDRLRLRNAFVAAQVAFSMTLIITAGVVAGGLDAVRAATRGFDPRGVDVATADLALGGYTATTGRVFARELLARLRALPGVEKATLADRAPGPGGMSLGGLTVPGVSPPTGQQYFFANWTLIESAYFETLRIPMIAGRDFSDADREGSSAVAIVGESAARRLWPGRDAVGQTVFVHAPNPGGAPTSIPLTVVGVVGDLVYPGFRGVLPLYLYVPLQQRYMPGTTILVRRSADTSLASDIRSLVSSMNPNLPVLTAQTLERQQSGPVETQLRIAATVAGALGLVGLLLAAIGVYGVASYAVAQRTREIGIRLSLGADRKAVVGMVLRQAMLLVAIGSGGGLLLGGGAVTLLSGPRFGVPPPDAALFAGATALFAIVGLAACYVPVRRATRIGAMEALRTE
jgi:putative ABC transport system permease protein